jgi:uncharacterized protein (DUF885 family)
MPPSSRIHEISDRYVDSYARLDPIGATYLGVTGYDHELTDYSPDGVRARSDAAAAAVREIRAETPADQSDKVAQAVFAERIDAELAVDEAGLTVAELNVIASPPQHTKSVFDLMPTETEEDWATAARRLAALPAALPGAGPRPRGRGFRPQGLPPRRPGPGTARARPARRRARPPVTGAPPELGVPAPGW